MLVFKAVIFDWDGTLADTRYVIVKSFQEALSEAGCSVGDEFIERRIGIGERNLFREILRDRDISFDNAMLDRLVEKKKATQLGMIAKVSLLDGAVELLDSLRGKVKIALATISSRKVIDRLLPAKNLRGYFDIVITTDDVHQPKPNPEIFLKSAKKLEVSSEECVVVEDSIFGVKAARNAGMKCIAVATGAYSMEELKKEGASLVVASLTDGERILDFILS